MFTLGIILIIIGVLASIPILYSIGVILAVIGAVLFVLGSMDAPSADGATTGSPDRSLRLLWRGGLRQRRREADGSAPSLSLVLVSTTLH